MIYTLNASKSCICHNRLCIPHNTLSDLSFFSFGVISDKYVCIINKSVYFRTIFPLYLSGYIVINLIRYLLCMLSSLKRYLRSLFFHMRHILFLFPLQVQSKTILHAQQLLFSDSS